jgi:hypothetical protein
MEINENLEKRRMHTVIAKGDVELLVLSKRVKAINSCNLRTNRTF